MLDIIKLLFTIILGWLGRKNTDVEAGRALQQVKEREDAIKVSERVVEAQRALTTDDVAQLLLAPGLRRPGFMPGASAGLSGAKLPTGNRPEEDSGE